MAAADGKIITFGRFGRLGNNRGKFSGKSYILLIVNAVECIKMKKYQRSLPMQVKDLSKEVQLLFMMTDIFMYEGLEYVALGDEIKTGGNDF